MRKQRRHSVITQSARVNWIGNELVPERVHFQQWRESGRIAEVVSVGTPGERRAGGWFDSPDGRVHPSGHLFPEERERQSAEVRATSGAANDDIGRVARLRQLLDGFLADDRLMHEDVIEDTAERVPGVLIAARDLDRFA